MYFFQALAIAGSVTLLIVVINFVRLGILKEKYSVLWLAWSMAIIALSLKRGILDSTATYLGIAYPPSLLFLVAFFFILLILLHFSVVISILHEKNKTLTQEITLIKNTLREAGLENGPAEKREGD